MKQENMGQEQGHLMVIPTPIGNLEDVTLRALRLLRTADLIAAEDTRRTKKLLNHYQIATPVISYYKEVEKRKTVELIDRIKLGSQVALVTDAGAPGISDPGQMLIAEARKAGVIIEILPGPSAVLTALVGSGLPIEAFSFYGFPDAKSSARKRFFTKIKDRTETMVFFISPHKLTATLQDMQECWGLRPVVLCREMTKIYEEFVSGTLQTLIDKFSKNSLGEMTLIVSGCLNPCSRNAESIEEHLKRCQAQGLTLNQAVARVAKEKGILRKEVYQFAHNLFKKGI